MPETDDRLLLLMAVAKTFDLVKPKATRAAKVGSKQFKIVFRDARLKILSFQRRYFANYFRLNSAPNS